MTSRVTIRRRSGMSAQDESTGKESPVWTVVYTDHPFRMGGSNQGSPGHRRVRLGEEEFEQALRIGHLPVATALADADLIDITAGEHVGLVLKVLESTPKDQSTALRVPVVEVDRPEEW